MSFNDSNLSVFKLPTSTVCLRARLENTSTCHSLSISGVGLNQESYELSLPIRREEGGERQMLLLTSGKSQTTVL